MYSSGEIEIELLWWVRPDWGLLDRYLCVRYDNEEKYLNLLHHCHCSPPPHLGAFRDIRSGLRDYISILLSYLSQGVVIICILYHCNAVQYVVV